MSEARSQQPGTRVLPTRGVTDALEVLDLEVRVLELEVGILDAPRLREDRAADQGRKTKAAGTQWQRRPRA